MSNYNERLDRVIKRAVAPAWLQQVHKTTNVPAYQLHMHEAKQAITSLIKELVAEAKPNRETIIDKWNKDRVDEVKATNAAMNAWADIYEQNLLKALEEV